MTESTTVPPGFRRKVLKLDKSPIKQPEIHGHTKTDKQIIPTQSKSSFRDRHRELYLPILIQVFELRGKLDQLRSPDPLTGPSESAATILEKLTSLETEISESRRWCDGVILQLSKALEEARKLLPEEEEEKSVSLIDRIKGWFKW
ncbi:MAG: hypothetical protein MRY21_05355 [Simkaniaceae bacterium]|nr:hypothetical protein [Simkaniaceae bacterium]